MSKILLIISLFLATVISLAQQKAAKFDTMGQIGCEEIKIRLENLSSVLKQNPKDKALIIYYGGKTYTQYRINKKPAEMRKLKFLPGIVKHRRALETGIVT